MTDTYKPLGQAATSDTYSSEAVVYEVPGNANAAISSVLITNTNDEEATYSLAVLPSTDAEDTTDMVDFGHDYTVEYTVGGQINGKHLKITNLLTQEVSYMYVPNVVSPWGYSVRAVNTVGDRLIVVLSKNTSASGGSGRFNVSYYYSSKVLVASTTDAVSWDINDRSDLHAHAHIEAINACVPGGLSSNIYDAQVDVSIHSVTVFNTGVISMITAGSFYDYAAGKNTYLLPQVVWLNSYAQPAFWNESGGIVGFDAQTDTPWGKGYFNSSSSFYDKDTDSHILGVLTYGNKTVFSADGITYYFVSFDTPNGLFSSYSYIPGYTFRGIRKLKNGKYMFSLTSPWGYTVIYNNLYFSDSWTFTGTSVVFSDPSIFSGEYVYSVVHDKLIPLVGQDEGLVFGVNNWVEWGNTSLTKRTAKIVSSSSLLTLVEIYSNAYDAPQNAATLATSYTYYNGERLVINNEYMDANFNWFPNNTGTVRLLSDVVTASNISYIDDTLVTVSPAQWTAAYNKGYNYTLVEDFHYYNVIPVYGSTIKNKIITKTIAPASTHTIDGGITLGEYNQIRIYSATNDVVAHVYGTEITGSAIDYKILGQKYVGKNQTVIPGTGGGTGGGGSYYYYYGGGPDEDTIIETLDPVVLYTVPAGKETVVSSLYVTNNDIVERTFDVAIVPAGETLALKHHIRWDMPVSASDFDLLTHKITMAAGDSIVVLPSTADKVGFTAFGVEK